MVADVLGLAPHRLPGLIKLLGLFLGYRKTVHEVGFLHALRGVLVLGQLEPEEGRLDDGLALVGHLIDGTARVIY